MRRWWCVALFALVTPLWAAVDIIGMPETPDERYDLVWEMAVKAPPAGALVVNVERSARGGYQLRVEKSVAVWQQTGVKNPLPAVKAPMVLEAGKRYDISIKRRAGTVAVLLDHRLVLTAPAPALGGGQSIIDAVPGGCSLGEVRYRKVARPAFGDDFMRPEAVRRTPSAQNPWVEDDTWKVAYYRRDYPATDPRDPKTNVAMTVPWLLSLFPTYQFTTNGFWYLYKGVGPSWVVANQTMVYPTWDQYFVETAVKPEFDSEVGLIAAYQDNKNYLIFRWKQREYYASTTPKAELIAVIDGEQKVLATDTRGFEPNQWYRLRINLGWRRVQALIDGDVLMDVPNPGPVEGRIGLYALGASNPRRPKLDEVTAGMYTANDAADALRKTSIILFDDVRAGEWLSSADTTDKMAYATEMTGKWKVDGETYEAQQAPAKLLMGPSDWNRYTATTRVKIPRFGSLGIFFHQRNNIGYLWTLNQYAQKVQETTGDTPGKELDRSELALKPGEWADLRVEADGPYVQMIFNNQPVMQHYDAARTGGRCGFLASSTGDAFQPFVVTQLDPKRKDPTIHEVFRSDKWLITWSSPEADWYPSFTPAARVTPQGTPLDAIGAAGPLPTNQKGLYWHKGGHYHDLTVSLPIAQETISGQTLHLSSNYDNEGGYRVQLLPAAAGGSVRLLRKNATIGDYPLTLGKRNRLQFLRRGTFLVLLNQEIDPDDKSDDPEVTAEKVVFCYRDTEPLAAEMIGFTVTDAKLPAALVQVDSDRIRDTFEAAPSGWITESGVWAVMARYSCQPQWNWFGGYGAYTPTVWSKNRLDGNQTVEAYIGIKMQFDNAPEEYGRRYRDCNVTICADGSHLNSGYSVIRAGRPDGRTVTMLVRKGVTVKETTSPEFLLPSQGTGHRQWFATRIEKRGGEIKVFLDNKLAMTYVDPDPLPGGFAGIWTLNNGIMIGRANLSAETMVAGAPRAAAPLALQDKLDPLPVPALTLNTAPLKIATFEDGMGDARERPGLTGRLVRERTTDAARGANTVLKIVNMYPAGDFSATLVGTERNLDTTPVLHADYCFEPGVQVNLYVHKQATWYEFLLTGKEAQEQNVYTVGRVPATADGTWRHLEINLGKMLADAVLKQTGKEMVDTTVQEIIVADWSAPSAMRAYGFGNNPGGKTIAFDNILLAPAITGAATLTWQQDGATAWKAGCDAAFAGLPATTTDTKSLTITPDATKRFIHLSGKAADGTWGPVVHIPLSTAKGESTEK